MSSVVLKCLTCIVLQASGQPYEVHGDSTPIFQGRKVKLKEVSNWPEVTWLETCRAGTQSWTVLSPRMKGSGTFCFGLCPTRAQML